jgi:hypothetical protein
MSFKTAMDMFITQNNARILSSFEIQPRYVPPEPTHAKRKEEKVLLKKSNEFNVNTRTKELLIAVTLFQYKKTSTEIYELAGLSLSTGSRIAKDCEKRNFIKTIKTNIARGNPRYPVLLSAGYQALGIEEKKFFSRGGGHEHYLYQKMIALHLSEYKPVIEMRRAGKFIDVGIETNEGLTGIEVAMSSVNEKSNIEKDFSMALADKVIVACKDKKVLKEVHEIVAYLSDNYRNKTEVCLISELLNKEPDEVINAPINI